MPGKSRLVAEVPLVDGAVRPVYQDEHGQRFVVDGK